MIRNTPSPYPLPRGEREKERRNIIKFPLLSGKIERSVQTDAHRRARPGVWAKSLGGIG